MKHSLTVIAALLACPSAFAAPAAKAEAAPLGRLFHTPAQRQQLDQNRSRPARPAAAAEELRVDGIVTSSDGRQTVWVNGNPASSSAEFVAVSPSTARLRASPQHPRSVEVPVGGSLRLISDDAP